MDDLRRLTLPELRRVYADHVKADFPPEERRPLGAMVRLLAQGVYDPFGLYEGEQLLGYAFLWRHDGAGCAMLDYLAVCRGSRGQGLGSRIVRLVLERYGADYLVFAEAEAETADAPPGENHQRHRRLEFYRRLGFTDMGYEALLFGVRYAMLRHGAPQVGDDTVMAAHRALYCESGRFPFKGHFIQIPAPN